MANLPESASFDAGIYQIETTDAVIGGVNGISNLQAKALANRTTWLKQQVDALNLLKGKGIAAFSAANSYAGGDQVIYQKNIWQANTAIVPGAWNAANWTRQLGTSAEGELSSTLPVIDGVAAIGTSTAVARADHQHPTDTTRAPLASPTFTGTPTAPTATAGTNTTQLATTAFVQSQIASSFPEASETVAGKVELATAAETTTGTDNTRAVHPAGLKVELDKKAPLASPALTGTPTAPTATAGTNTTQLATTAFVQSQIASSFPEASETVAGKVELATAAETTTGTDNTRAVHPAGLKVELDKKAPLASPALTGTPTAPTAATGTRSTAIATMQNFANEFGSSLAANGYQKLPSGLIIQWGQTATIPQGANVITLPIAFISANLAVVITATAVGGTAQSHDSVTSRGLTSFTLANAASISNPFNWIAIGY